MYSSSQDEGREIPLLFLRGLALTPNEKLCVQFPDDETLRPPFCCEYESKHRISADSSSLFAQVLLAKKALLKRSEPVLIVDAGSSEAIMRSLLEMNAKISLAKKAVENSYATSRLLERQTDLDRVRRARDRLLLFVINATVDFNNLFGKMLVVRPDVALVESAFSELRVSDPENVLEMIVREMESLPVGAHKLVHLNNNDPVLYLAAIRALQPMERG